MSTPVSFPCLARLQRARNPVRRRALLEQCAGEPECVTECLEAAQQALAVGPDEALKRSGLAVEIAERTQSPALVAGAWRSRGQALRLAGRHGEAIAAFQSAANAAQDGGEMRLAAQVQIGAIDSLGWIGRYDEAFELASRLETVLRANDAALDAAKVLVNAGNLYCRRDRYADALGCYERALEALQSADDALAIARIQVNCANMLAQLNRVDESLVLFEQARATFSAHQQPTMSAMLDAGAGYLHYLSGEHSAALTALLRARAVLSNRRQEVEVAKCDADLADVYRETNLFPEALECYDRAIAVFQRQGIVYEHARAELGRGAVLMSLDRFDEAFSALEIAEAQFSLQKNGLGRAHVRLLRAYMLRAVGRDAEASTEARRTIPGLVRNRAGGLAVAARLLCAEIAQGEGNDVCRQLHTISRAASLHSRRWLVCRAERALGLHYLRKQDLRRAIRHFRLGLVALEEARTLIASEEIHVAFLRDKLAIYEDLVAALLERGRPADIAEAMECVERSKSRLLLERLQSVVERQRDRSDPALVGRRERLAALHAELSRRYHSLYSQEAGAPSRLVGGGEGLEPVASLEQSYRQALRELEMAEASGVSSGIVLSTPVSLECLRGALLPDETLIEFYVVNGVIVAFLLNSQGVHVHRALARCHDVAIAARKLRFQLQRVGLAATYVETHRRQMQAGVDSALRDLYELLFAPLEPWLRTEKLIVVPHGMLHGIPFHAFYTGIDYLVDRYELLYAPSAGVWYSGARRRTGQGAQAAGTDRAFDLLIMGVPDPQIAHVAHEVAEVADLFPGARQFCGDAATLAAFRTQAGQCRRIHLATHALFRKDNPLFSGLRFADGWLLASDLADVPLQCDLATLSACRTGTAFVESGDELFGLLRGFLMAGARSVAASLWPADDAATALLMVRFYSEIARGRSHAAALRLAQQATREVYPHPYYWAAFTLVGER